MEQESKELDDQKGEDLSDKLLPCPFCGDINITLEDQVDMNGFGDCRATCEGCMTRSDIYTDEDGDRKLCTIKAWNTRASSKQLQENEYLKSYKESVQENYKTQSNIIEDLQKQLTATQQALDGAKEEINSYKIIIDEEVKEYYEGCKDIWAENKTLKQALDAMVEALKPIFEEIETVFHNFDLCDASHIEGEDAAYNVELLEKFKAALTR